MRYERFVTRRKIWKQRDVSVRNYFKSHVNEFTKNSDADTFLGYWKVLKGALKRATNWTCE